MDSDSTIAAINSLKSMIQQKCIDYSKINNIMTILEKTKP